ncbi:MAG: YkgJ family cysteine cluster protein [Promethearchaeota archaeon]
MKFPLVEEIREGFYFKCHECGNCCTGKDEGYVFVYKEDILNISNFYNMHPSEFVKKYCEIIETEYRVFDDNLTPTPKKIFIPSIVLKQDQEDGSCIFLNKETKKCKIYDVRPKQCRTWPVWYNIMTKKSCLKDAKKKCMGIHDKSGTLIKVEEINQILKEEIIFEKEYIETWKKLDKKIENIFPFLKEE